MAINHRSNGAVRPTCPDHVLWGNRKGRNHVIWGGRATGQFLLVR